ncbi:hypothetical protein NT07LI_0605, partial [Listeria innocua FSL S4-378]
FMCINNVNKQEFFVFLNVFFERNSNRVGNKNDLT